MPTEADNDLGEGEESHQLLDGIKHEQFLKKSALSLAVAFRTCSRYTSKPLLSTLR